MHVELQCTDLAGGLIHVWFPPFQYWAWLAMVDFVVVTLLLEHNFSVGVDQVWLLGTLLLD